MSDIIVGAFIADIHFDASDDDELYRQLKANFIEPIKKLPKLDMVVIGGDTYHSKVQLESKASKLSMKFINNDVVSVIKDKGSCLRIIRGTYSHDNDQLDNFLHLESRDDIDVKIIKTVETETYNGFRFLYIPEEYMKDKDEYYKEYLGDNKYDMAFGHGKFEAVAYDNNHGEISMKHSPIFSNNYFKNNVKGPVLFGDIHQYNEIAGQVYYPGSFSRWSQGDDKKKGFLIFVYNKVTNKFLVLPHWNNQAPKYITMDLDSYLSYPVETIISAITKTFESENVAKLRLNISYGGNNKVKSANIKVIKDYFSGRKDIVINIKNKKIQKMESEKKEIVSKFNYIFNKNKSIEDKLSKYILEEMDYKISEEKIKNILFGNILDDIAETNNDNNIMI